jgi:hypothetical protein
MIIVFALFHKIKLSVMMLNAILLIVVAPFFSFEN